MGIRKYLGITFLAGLFLTGIGGGVAFVEFSSFHLGEATIIGEEYMETKVFKEKIPQETGNIYVFLGGVDQSNVEIVADPSMANDEIEIQAEYNGNAVESHLGINVETNEIYRNYYISDFYGFNYMDDILTSIKNKKIPNYRMKYFGKHVIRVAPENEERLVVYG